MNTEINRLISRLEGVVDCHNGKWHAICPCHKHNNPSLTIRLRHDGKITIYCEAGCSSESVLKALGLRWADIYGDKWAAAYAGAIAKTRHRPDTFGAVLDMDKIVLQIAASRLRSGQKLPIEDEARIEIARRRLLSMRAQKRAI